MGYPQILPQYELILMYDYKFDKKKVITVICITDALRVWLKMNGPEEALQVKSLPNWAILKMRSAHEKARHSKPCGMTAPPQSPIAPFVGPLPISEVQRVSILEANEIWLSNSKFR